MNNIHPSLMAMAFPVESLQHLEDNPRKGNVEAIASSYREFGQVKPIVARHNDDGTATVIAGNHQLMAAKKLGWDEIAVVFLDADDKKAIAYALADNRTMELGYTDDDMLHKLLTEVSTDYGDLWTDLGWDEFEIAAIEQKATLKANDEITNSAYVPPVIISPPQQKVSEDVVQEINSFVGVDSDGETKLLAPRDMDQTEIAVKGSTVALPGAAPQAIVSVQVVFDSPEQQRKWYDFVRWLRTEPSIDGTTTAERLINFIEAHTEV
jgi:hypothetical protein